MTIYPGMKVLEASDRGQSQEQELVPLMANHMATLAIRELLSVI